MGTIVLVHGAWRGAWCWATFGQPIRTATWERTPSTYVACTDDRAITIEMQRLMAARCGSVVVLPASHSPFLSMPARVADVLEPLARARGERP